MRAAGVLPSFFKNPQRLLILRDGRTHVSLACKSALAGCGVGLFDPSEGAARAQRIEGIERLPAPCLCEIGTPS